MVSSIPIQYKQFSQLYHLNDFFIQYKEIAHLYGFKYSYSIQTICSTTWFQAFLSNTPNLYSYILLSILIKCK